MLEWGRGPGPGRQEQGAAKREEHGPRAEPEDVAPGQWGQGKDQQGQACSLGHGGAGERIDNR